MARISHGGQKKTAAGAIISSSYTRNQHQPPLPGIIPEKLPFAPPSAARLKPITPAAISPPMPDCLALGNPIGNIA